MPAPKGNQFWKLRSKHGRDKLFATPELLWEEACNYFEWCDKTPIKTDEVVKSGILAGTLIKVPKKRPYTIQGLCIYLDANTEFFNQFRKEMRERTDKEAKDFSCIINKIDEIIYQQKFEGAVVGLFNSNIIARDLGLRDKQDLTSNGEQIATPTAIQVQIIPPEDDE